MIKSILAAVGAAITGVAIYANLPLGLTLPFKRLDLSKLSLAPLQNLQTKENFEEAAQLASLKSQFNDAHFNLFAVVHERFGVDGFQPYFKGEVFQDVEKQFFGGANPRWMSVWHGFLRPSVWLNGYRASKAGFEGNMKGEGRILGGVYVIGAGDAGVLYEHHEAEFGDHADMDAILKAVKNSIKSK